MEFIFSKPQDPFPCVCLFVINLPHWSCRDIRFPLPSFHDESDDTCKQGVRCRFDLQKNKITHTHIPSTHLWICFLVSNNNLGCNKPVRYSSYNFPYLASLCNIRKVGSRDATIYSKRAPCFLLLIIKGISIYIYISIQIHSIKKNSIEINHRKVEFLNLNCDEKKKDEKKKKTELYQDALCSHKSHKPAWWSINLMQIILHRSHWSDVGEKNEKKKTQKWNVRSARCPQDGLINSIQPILLINYFITPILTSQRSSNIFNRNVSNIHIGMNHRCQSLSIGQKVWYRCIIIEPTIWIRFDRFPKGWRRIIFWKITFNIQN